MIDRRTFLTSAAAAGPARVPPRGVRAAEAAWGEAASMPQAVQEIHPALHAERLRVAGGIATVGEGRDAVTLTQIHDPSADAWTIGPGLPERRRHNMLIEAGGTLYSMGGHRGAGGDGVRDLVAHRDRRGARRHAAPAPGRAGLRRDRRAGPRRRGPRPRGRRRRRAPGPRRRDEPPGLGRRPGVLGRGRAGLGGAQLRRRARDRRPPLRRRRSGGVRAHPAHRGPRPRRGPLA